MTSVVFLVHFVPRIFIEGFFSFSQKKNKKHDCYTYAHATFSAIVLVLLSYKTVKLPAKCRPTGNPNSGKNAHG
jgi:hypothetical protein